jgi:26S proteasome regulatory subunit N2
MTPTTLIGLNEDLKVPKSFSFTSGAKPSTFAYPEMMKKEEKKKDEKVETAVLSITKKVIARKDRKDKAEGRAETPTPTPEKQPDNQNVDMKDKKTEEEEKKNEEEKVEEKEEEPLF